MAVKIKFELIENLLFAEMAGVITVPEISDFFMRLFLNCEEAGVKKVLVEANTQNSTVASDKYAQLKIFEEIKFPSDISIAWVNYNPNTIESSRSTVLLLKSRGIFVVDIFDSIEEGLEWLLDEEASIEIPHEDLSEDIERLLAIIEDSREFGCNVTK